MTDYSEQGVLAAWLVGRPYAGTEGFDCCAKTDWAPSSTVTREDLARLRRNLEQQLEWVAQVEAAMGEGGKQ